VWSVVRVPTPEEEDARRAHRGGKRLRRIGIVALARRLAIALWRYLEHGLIPDGAQLKPIGE
jgi:transposase